MSVIREPLHHTLFRLAARAPELTLDALMQRVTTALSNHYAAVACTIHTNLEGWPSATAEPIRAVRKMPRLDQARRETIEARLVKTAIEGGGMTSALDLDHGEDVAAFFERTLGIIDMFAFPLRFEGKIVAVLVLYLSLDSDPLAEADIHGLMAVGGLLALALPNPD